MPHAPTAFWPEESGAHCIGLHTSPIMTVALPMYRRMGFVEDSEMPAIAGAPDARYVLRFDVARSASPPC